MSGSYRADDAALRQIIDACPAICDKLPGDVPRALAELMKRTAYPLGLVVHLFSEARGTTYRGLRGLDIPLHTYRMAVNDASEKVLDNFVLWVTSGAYMNPDQPWPIPIVEKPTATTDGGLWGAVEKLGVKPSEFADQYLLQLQPQQSTEEDKHVAIPKKPEHINTDAPSVDAENSELIGSW